MWQRKFCLLIIFVITSIIFYTYSERFDLATPVSFALFTREYTPEVGCIDGFLLATSIGLGTGNVVFEFLSLLGLAAQTNRELTITNDEVLRRLTAVSKNFPNFRIELDRIGQTNCTRHVSELFSGEHCCRYNKELTGEIKKSGNNTVKLKLKYVQSHMYFHNFEREDILKLLEGSRDATYAAETKLFERVANRTNHKNICVHIRRGDYLAHPNLLASHTPFTRASVEFLINQESTNCSRPVHVYVMSDDEKWSTRVLEGLKNVHFSMSSTGSPPNVEWEFSKKYCDVTLLTASTSTYGWWLGYLSRGQTVYFNGNFACPNGKAKELIAEDYWMPHWVPLLLSPNTSKIEVSSFAIFNRSYG